MEWWSPGSRNGSLRNTVAKLSTGFGDNQIIRDELRANALLSSPYAALQLLDMGDFMETRNVNLKEGLRRFTWVLSMAGGLIGGLSIQAAVAAQHRRFHFEDRVFVFLVGGLACFLLVWIIYHSIRWIQKGLQYSEPPNGDSSASIASPKADGAALNSADNTITQPDQTSFSTPPEPIDTVSESTAADCADSPAKAQDLEVDEAVDNMTERTPDGMDEVKDEPDSVGGLGGWLLVFGFLIGLALFFGPFGLYSSVTVASSPLLPSEAASLLWVDIVANTGLYVYLVIVAAHFFRLKRTAPLVIKRYLKTRFIVYIFILLLEVSMDVPEFWVVTLLMLLVSGLMMAIWIPYFNRSQRVKRTFVRA